MGDLELLNEALSREFLGLDAYAVDQSAGVDTLHWSALRAATSQRSIPKSVIVLPATP